MIYRGPSGEQDAVAVEAPRPMCGQDWPQALTAQFHGVHRTPILSRLGVLVKNRLFGLLQDGLGLLLW